MSPGAYFKGTPAFTAIMKNLPVSASAYTGRFTYFAIPVEKFAFAFSILDSGGGKWNYRTKPEL